MNYMSKPVMIPNYDKTCLKKSKNCKIRKKSKNFETPYKNLEKYGSFSKFHTSTKKSVKAGLHQNTNTNAACVNDAYVHMGKFVDCSAFAEEAN